MWMCCGVAANVLSDSAASLSGYVASTAASKKKNLKKPCRHKNWCPRWHWWASRTARMFFEWCRRLPLGGRVCSARAPLGSTQRTKEDTFNLSTKPREPRGALWTYSGSAVVLSWDLTHKNTQTGTRTSQSHWLLLAQHKHMRFAPSAYKTYAFAQRHKSDKNIPVNLAKTATLPFLPLTSKCSI